MPRFWVLGSLGNRGVAWPIVCFLGQIDGPKYFLHDFYFWPGWGRLDFMCSLGGFEDYRVGGNNI